DANVLRVVHSVTLHPPEGEPPIVVAAIPLQVAPVPVRRVGLQLTYIPWRPDGGDPKEHRAVLLVLATWVPPGPTGSRWRELADAFDAFADGRFEDAALPANLAVETTLRELIDGCLQ